MIEEYKIKYINNEKVLILYFDFNYEFASFNFKSKKEKIKQIIKKYIVNSNELINIGTVLLVSGGIIFGTVNLNSDVNNKKIIETRQETKQEIEQVIEKESVIEQKDNENIEKKAQEFPKEEINKTNNNTVEIEEKTKENNISKNNNVVNKQTTDNKKVESNVNDDSLLKKSEAEEQKNEVVDNKIYVNVKRSNGNTIKLELEEYVIGVVSIEMPASFNIEALKSQAIIARTYALKANKNGKILTDNESTQSYRDNNELKNMWKDSYNTYYSKVKSAVSSTEGMYLTYNGDYIEALYHSTSNSKTEDAKNVWGKAYPYLVSVDSEYDYLNPSYEMTKTFNYDEISNKLGIEITDNTVFNITDKTEGDRVAKIFIDEKSYTGVEIRNLLGLRSADFIVIKENENILFKTKGYGHGVGLSQYGANGMAKNGSNYIDIIKHYYKGVSINKL